MLTLGDVPGQMRLALDPDADFVARIEYQDPPGTPTPWPTGTTAWLHLSTRAGFATDWIATIAGALMSWQVTSADVATVPLSASAELWLEFPGNPAFIWLTGGIGGCGGPISATVAVPGATAGAVAVPVPGPAGQDGQLDPADMEQITEDATEAVLVDLEPPVNLVLLFNNALV